MMESRRRASSSETVRSPICHAAMWAPSARERKKSYIEVFMRCGPYGFATGPPGTMRPEIWRR